MPRSLKPYGPGTAQFSPCMVWRYELTRDLSACPHPAKPSPELLDQLSAEERVALDLILGGGHGPRLNELVPAPNRQHVVRMAAAGLAPRAGILLSVGLNPSTATGDDDDPTIHKESGWALAWGYALYLKYNAYGYRATKPDHMFTARDRGIDIVGPGNDDAIRAAIARVRREGGRVLAGWGQHVEPERQVVLAGLLHDVEVVCVDVNKNGTPSHPLYKSGDRLQAWSCPPLATSRSQAKRASMIKRRPTDVVA